MGTPDFSAKVLQKLNKSYPVCAAVTGMDKQIGRGRQIKYSPLKEKALELGIPVMQYERVSRDGLDDIIAIQPDIIVTAAFGQILSEKLLSVPKFGVLNVHASLLPKYRGASPIQWAIINGEEQTGITIMRTVKEVDAGDILLSRATAIGDKENAGELFDRLADIGGDAITEAIALIENGKAVFSKQNETEASHCSMITKTDGIIDFSKTAKQINCFVRGMTPWPSAYVVYCGKIIKVFDAEPVYLDNDVNDAENGSVIFADTKHGLVVKSSGGAVRLKLIQLQGAKRMSDAEFLLGRKIEVGYCFK